MNNLTNTIQMTTKTKLSLIKSNLKSLDIFGEQLTGKNTGSELYPSLFENGKLKRAEAEMLIKMKTKEIRELLDIEV